MVEYKSQKASPPSSLSCRLWLRLSRHARHAHMLDMLPADTAIWDELDADPLSLLALLARRARLGTPALPSAYTNFVTHFVTHHALTHHAITQEAQTQSTPPRQNDQRKRRRSPPPHICGTWKAWNMRGSGCNMCNMTHSKTARPRWLYTNRKRPLLPPPSRLGSGCGCVDMLV